MDHNRNVDRRARNRARALSPTKQNVCDSVFHDPQRANSTIKQHIRVDDHQP